MYPSMGIEQSMSRWHFAALSTSLFILAGVLFFLGLGLVAAPLGLIGWGVMTVAAWEPLAESVLTAEADPVPNSISELEPVLVKSSE